MPKPVPNVAFGEDFHTLEPYADVFNRRQGVVLPLDRLVQVSGVEADACSFPLGFTTSIIELIHSDGVVTGAVMSCCVRVSSSSFTFPRSVTGMCLGACCTGCADESSGMWYSPSDAPVVSVNTFKNFAVRFAAVSGFMLTLCTSAFPTVCVLTALLSLYCKMAIPRQAFLPSNAR